jgi:hypothetical protein
VLHRLFGSGRRRSFCTLSRRRPVISLSLSLSLTATISVSYCFFLSSHLCSLTGSSSNSETFNNDCLSDSPDFAVKDVEVFKILKHCVSCLIRCIHIIKKVYVELASVLNSRNRAIRLGVSFFFKKISINQLFFLQLCKGFDVWTSTCSDM